MSTASEWRHYPGLTVLILALTLGFPAHAWKTKAVMTNSPHSRISDAALELVRRHDAATGGEVDRFRATLSRSSGWLNNDANAHGNILWNNERWDPTSGESANPGDLEYWAPINFNGGPFYRWWIRALQAEALCSSTFFWSSTAYDAVGTHEPFENGLDEWGRTNTGVSAHRIYQYFGLMAHLIQDNNAPAHIANIRHGWWEGVEWWHDEHAWTLGGGGRDTPDLAKAGIMIDEKPRAGAHGCRVAFIHPSETGGVLMELSQETPVTDHGTRESAAEPAPAGRLKSRGFPDVL